jgi:membrane protease YdiL (CAAX protease family)
VKWAGGLRAADFGFRRIPIPAAVGATVLAAVVYYVLSAIYASALHFHGNEKLPRELGVSNSTAALAGAAVFVCLIAPVAEEFFFRGFVFGVLRRLRIVVAGRQLGPWVAAVITGILFGLAHTGSASSRYLVPLGFLGFVLCLVRWRTRSLYPCIALHSLNNSLALGVGQLSWNAPEVIGLVVGSVATAVAVTLPLSGSRRTHSPVQV